MLTSQLPKRTPWVLTDRAKAYIGAQSVILFHSIIFSTSGNEHIIMLLIHESIHLYRGVKVTSITNNATCWVKQYFQERSQLAKIDLKTNYLKLKMLNV